MEDALLQTARSSARQNSTIRRGTHVGGKRLALPYCRPYPGTVVAPCPFAALVVILAASAAASINPAVFGMFEMPFVPNVQLAQQGLDHGSLRFKSQRSVPLIMASTSAPRKWQNNLLPRRHRANSKRWTRLGNES
jgi:hypothetical protein